MKKSFKMEKYERRFEKNSNLFSFNDSDLDLIKEFQEININILGILLENNKKGNNFQINNDILEEVKKSRDIYDRNFRNPQRNSRNPLLQNMVDEYLERTNYLRYEIIKSFSKEKNSETRGTWTAIDFNMNSYIIFDKKLDQIIGNIQSIAELSNLTSNSNNQRRGEIFLLCVNSRYELPEGNLDVNDEFNHIKAILENDNIRHIVLVNSTKELFLTVLKHYSPNKNHFIGHGKTNYLLFGSKARVTSDEIISSLGRDVSDFFIINACDSDMIARDLSIQHFRWTIGYFSNLKNSFATEFSKKLYPNCISTDNFAYNYKQTLNSVLSCMKCKENNSPIALSACFNCRDGYRLYSNGTLHEVLNSL